MSYNFSRTPIGWGIGIHDSSRFEKLCIPKLSNINLQFKLVRMRTATKLRVLEEYVSIRSDISSTLLKYKNELDAIKSSREVC